MPARFLRLMTDYPTDPRRKRILYRATHRGTKEADAIIGGYFTDAAASVPDGQLAEVEEFLELSDLDLIDWLWGRSQVPERWQGTVFDQVLAFYRAMGTP